MLNLTAVEGLLKASCSPLEVLEGESRTIMPLTAVSMVLLRNMMVLHLPLAPGGMPMVAVMAVPMAGMPAPFDGAGSSRGEREGIVESEENNLYHNLSSNPIVVTPFLRIPPSFWYRN
jgi:hypothetical protein